MARIRLKDDPDQVQAAFYERTSPHLRPDYVGRAIRYEHASGSHPTQLTHSLYQNVLSLWDDGDAYLQCDPFEYCRYIRSIDSTSYVLCKPALDLIASEYLNRVKNFHGDMTFENIVIDDVTHQARFIDPGHARGCPCQELDRGKLLQSCMGWEYAKRIGDWPRVKAPTDWARPIDWAFLLTHIVRLLRHHKRNVRVASWADMTIKVCLERIQP